MSQGSKILPGIVLRLILGFIGGVLLEVLIRSSPSFESRVPPHPELAAFLSLITITKWNHFPPKMK